MLNAVTHQRWDYPTQPAVYIFKDRIEIISHGGMPKGQTKEQLLKGFSVVRNVKLMQISSDFDFAEQSGHGVLDIVKVYGEKAIYIAEHLINVTIPFNLEVAATIPTYSQKVSDVPQKIKEMIELDSNITRSQIASKLGISTKTVARALKELNITWIGSSKGGHWEIT